MPMAGSVGKRRECIARPPLRIILPLCPYALRSTAGREDRASSFQSRRVNHASTTSATSATSTQRLTPAGISPPARELKISGVALVERAGAHENDASFAYPAQTIQLLGRLAFSAYFSARD